MQIRCGPSAGRGEFDAGHTRGTHGASEFDARQKRNSNRENDGSGVNRRRNGTAAQRSKRVQEDGENGQA